MKMRLILSVILGLAVSLNLSSSVEAGRQAPDDSILRGPFDLAGKRLQEAQYFVMETRFINYALNGTRTGQNSYRLHLKFVPAKSSRTSGDEYVCSDFAIVTGDSLEVTVPSLKDWSYVFKRTPTGLDEKGQVFGIEHDTFENLVDSNGKPIPQQVAYFVYNTFIDFHTFCNEFAEKTLSGNGIQDLTRIGQKIVHAAAFSKPPVNLGSNVAEGSFFQNGEITLTFKGISLVGEAPCAIVGFDSGESNFKMIMYPMPGVEMPTIGSSHYKGDIYIDLATNWVRRVVMDEYVLAETSLPFPPDKVNSFTERNTVIENVGEREFLNAGNRGR